VIAADEKVMTFESEYKSESEIRPSTSDCGLIFTNTQNELGGDDVRYSFFFSTRSALLNPE
jgi:hypothetical protein